MLVLVLVLVLSLGFLAVVGFALSVLGCLFWAWGFGSLVLVFLFWVLLPGFLDLHLLMQQMLPSDLLLLCVGAVKQRPLKNPGTKKKSKPHTHTPTLEEYSSPCFPQQAKDQASIHVLFLDL